VGRRRPMAPREVLARTACTLPSLHHRSRRPGQPLTLV
jgi:hypothetical protein